MQKTLHYRRPWFYKKKIWFYFCILIVFRQIVFKLQYKFLRFHENLPSNDYFFIQTRTLVRLFERTTFEDGNSKKSHENAIENYMFIFFSVISFKNQLYVLFRKFVYCFVLKWGEIFKVHCIFMSYTVCFYFLNTLNII